jgi:hypothetical protein
MKRRKILLAVLAVAAILALLYVNRSYFNSQPENGRVVGMITYGPTIPGPCMEGTNCSDKAYNGTVFVWDTVSGAKSLEFRPDDNGIYDVNLKQGKYFFEVSTKFVSTCGKIVQVESGNTVNETFSCDTGIR